MLASLVFKVLFVVIRHGEDDLLYVSVPVLLKKKNFYGSLFFLYYVSLGEKLEKFRQLTYLSANFWKQ